MDASELKEYILKNNKIEYILENIGCYNIKETSKEFRCASEEYHNSTSIRVKKNDSISATIFSSKKDLQGDIITLTMELCGLGFPQAVRKIHDILKIKYTFNSKKDDSKKVDILCVFKKHKKKVSYQQNEELNTYTSDICDEFVSLPYIGWVREGIMPYTQNEFGIGYSIKNNRVIIPHRLWSGDRNTYVGVIGRTLNEHYDILDIPKYYPLVKYPKSQNIYGLQENYDGIQKAGHVTVFEAEKSTLKRHSMLDRTGVSVCSHTLSDKQIKILISLGVEIIIAYDKDISLEHILSECEKFKGLRKVSFIYDEYGMLKSKESPADAREKIYQYLFKNRIEYKKGMVGINESE